MNDLISRQVTLDALMEAVKEVGVLDKEDIKTIIALAPTATTLTLSENDIRELKERQRIKWEQFRRSLRD